MSLDSVAVGAESLARVLSVPFPQSRSVSRLRLHRGAVHGFGGSEVEQGPERSRALGGKEERRAQIHSQPGSRCQDGVSVIS
jgi:hypothetical protein